MNIIYRKAMAFVILSNQWVVIILSLFSFAIVNVSVASEMPLSSSTKFITIEYLAPTKNDRDINTTNIDINYLITNSVSLADKVNLKIYFGLIATYATGSITQLEGSIEEGDLREVNFDNSAFGLGPGLLVSFQLWSSNRFSFYLNGRGNFIVYNKKFPAGGDYYNFMWRAGPAFEYQVGHSNAIGVGYNWAHISNGQGVDQKNPSYGAKGIMLKFTGFF